MIKGVPDAQIERLYGGYSASTAADIWRRHHISQLEMRTSALAVLVHEQRFGDTSRDRISAAKALADCVDRYEFNEERKDKAYRDNATLRAKAAQELTRPTRAMQELFIELWGQASPRPPIEDMMMQILPNWTDLIEKMGYRRVDD